MKKIYIITDYKGYFESKHGAIPYKSGFNLNILKDLFNNQGYDIKFLEYGDINFRTMDFSGIYFLYTSSEDYGYHYKDYIEDIIYGLELGGGILLPPYKFLRANNNKVFMEILRHQINSESINNFKVSYFGILEDVHKAKSTFDLNNTLVIKSSKGAGSTGVLLSNSYKDLIKKIKQVSETFYPKAEFYEFIRTIIKKDYKLESKYRNKYVLHEFIANVENDWKVLVYCDKIFILKRNNRKNDFRASGSGNFTFDYDIPVGLLEYAKEVYSLFNVPNISLDIIHKDGIFYLIEFQALYFGTSTLTKSPFYFQLTDKKWIKKEGVSILEEVYVESIVKYINQYEKRNGY